MRTSGVPINNALNAQQIAMINETKRVSQSEAQNITRDSLKSTKHKRDQIMSPPFKKGAAGGVNENP